jgi:pimeloyl-ACP methyl ester carboxylesterase
VADRPGCASRSSADDDVEDAIIPDCGHWITEEQPQATTDLVVDFLRRAR